MSIFNAEQRAAWDRDGYVMVRKLFDDEEIAILRGAIEGDPALRDSLYDRRDASGKATRMAVWNHPGESAYGLAARSRGWSTRWRPCWAARSTTTTRS